MKGVGPGLPEAKSLPNVRVVDLFTRKAARAHFRRQEEPVDAVPTPLETWNRHCRDEGGGKGLARGWHVAVAGATGAGKSVAGLNLGASALACGEHVGFVSLEMSREQLATRLYAIVTETDVRTIERGDEFDPTRAREVERRIEELRERTGGAFFTNDAPLLEIDRIVSFIRYLHEVHGCRFFVLDYLQLAAARDAETLFRQVSNVSAAVREVAQRLKVVTVGLSQLNRSTSSDYETKPRVQGLMASSSLENDADQVLLLDHSRYNRLQHERRALTWAILGKNRHGGQGEIPIELDYRTLRIREAKPHEEEEWP